MEFSSLTQLPQKAPPLAPETGFATVKAIAPDAKPAQPQPHVVEPDEPTFAVMNTRHVSMDARSAPNGPSSKAASVLRPAYAPPRSASSSRDCSRSWCSAQAWPSLPDAALARQPMRADFVDRNGVLIARDLPVSDLYATPAAFWDTDEAATRSRQGDGRGCERV